MNCPQCKSYIPQGLGLTVCPSCDLSIEDAERLVEAEKRKAVQRKIQEQVIAEEKVKLASGWTAYKMFQGFYMVFYSPSFYVDVARRWGGGCLFYSFIIMGLMFPSLLVRKNESGFSMNTYYQSSRKLLDQIPVVTFQNGKVSVSAPEPLMFKLEDGSVFGVIDTTGKIQNFDVLPAHFLLTADKFFYRNNNKIESGTISPTVSYQLDRSKALFWLSLFEKGIIFFIIPSLWVGFWIGMLFYAFAYMLVGKLISALMKLQVTWGSLWRLSIMALVPGIFIESYLVAPWIVLKGAADWSLSVIPIIYLIAAFIALKRYKPVTQELPLAGP